MGEYIKEYGDDGKSVLRWRAYRKRQTNFTCSGGCFATGVGGTYPTILDSAASYSIHQWTSEKPLQSPPPYVSFGTKENNKVLPHMSYKEVYEH